MAQSDNKFSFHYYSDISTAFIRNSMVYNYTGDSKNNKFQPITRRQILDSSKLKDFADDNFKVDENGRKLSKWVENTCYQQFLLFPQCFQKACFPGASKGVIVWEWVKTHPSRESLQITNQKAKILEFCLQPITR